MKECGWKIYVHQHFFFSPNNNHLSPKMMVDLGENRMAAGRKNQSCPSVHPSINHILQPTWQKGAKLQKISVKERLKRLEAQREAARKRLKAVKYDAKNTYHHKPRNWYIRHTLALSGMRLRKRNRIRNTEKI